MSSVPSLLELAEPAGEIDVAGRGVARALSLKLRLTALGEELPERLSFGRLGLLRSSALGQLLELGERLGADLVGGAAVLDEGVVLGHREPALEAHARARGLEIERAGPVELRDRGRVVGIALERAAEARIEAAALLAFGGAADRQREIAAGNGLIVGEGVVDHGLRVDIAGVVAAAPGDAGRNAQCQC